MNWDPANVERSFWSLNSLSAWTWGSSSEPYAAEAMMHALDGVVDVVTVRVNVTVLAG